MSLGLWKFGFLGQLQQKAQYFAALETWSNDVQIWWKLVCTHILAQGPPWSLRHFSKKNIGWPNVQPLHSVRAMHKHTYQGLWTSSPLEDNFSLSTWHSYLDVYLQKYTVYPCCLQLAYPQAYQITDATTSAKKQRPVTTYYKTKTSKTFSVLLG